MHKQDNIENLVLSYEEIVSYPQRMSTDGLDTLDDYFEKCQAAMKSYNSPEKENYSLPELCLVIPSMFVSLGVVGYSIGALGAVIGYAMSLFLPETLQSFCAIYAGLGGMVCSALSTSTFTQGKLDQFINEYRAGRKEYQKNCTLRMLKSSLEDKLAQARLPPASEMIE